MQEVHADLKRLKGMQSPLDGVADKIAKKARVICFDELFVSDIADAMILAGLFAALLETRRRAGVHLQRETQGSLQERPAARPLPAHHRADREELRSRQCRWRRGLSPAPAHRGAHLPADAAPPTRTKRLEELFDDLSDDDVESDGTITVHNRKIKVVRESENVIWFEFAALCEGPRSPADYVCDRQRVPVGDHRQRAGVRRGRRQCRAAVHLGDRRVLRPRRERDRFGGRRSPASCTRARSSSSSSSARRAGSRRCRARSIWRARIARRG